MNILLNNSDLTYSGRIDWSDPTKPEFVYPATSLHFRFYGKKAVLTIENRRVCWTNYVGAIVDGTQKKWEINDEGETAIVLVDEETQKEHDVLFFKRMDCAHEIKLVSLEISDGGKLLDAPLNPERRIEVYGDSVSAGEVSEAVEYTKKPDPEHHGQYSNSWYSYAWMTARKLNAQMHDISQGGIPLLNGTGWVTPPWYPGMEFMWDKLHYQIPLGRITDWDFKQYTPHLVIIAIGQNDSHPDDYMKSEPNGKKAQWWKEKYKEFVENIRKKYPKALIILATTILNHDENWDKAIDEVCVQLNDDRIRHFMYSKNGKGTPGHIRISEAEEMSDELAAYVNSLDIPVWDY